MNNFFTLSLTLLLTTGMTCAQQKQKGYQPGDIATDFKLKGVKGKTISLSDFPEAKGFIVIFSCNHCPFVKASEDRMIALHKKFAPKGYPVIAINPNDPEIIPEDAFEKMQERAEAKNFPFPYLVDETQKIARTYGASRTPEVFLLQKTKAGPEVVYTGAIDDNVQEPDKVQKRYVEAAIKTLEKGNTPKIQKTKAIGCTIKWREG